MAQPSSTSQPTTNFAVDTAKYLQQFTQLNEQLAAQQTQFIQNSNSSKELQQNIADNDLKQMEKGLNSINITNKSEYPPKSGIIAATQGTLTVLHNNKQIKTNHYQSSKYMDFASMSTILRPELIDGCDKMNFVHPSKIQAEAIPRCLSPSFPNLIGQAHHGSGKTATFSLIMLQRIDENISSLQGLVIVHSRELAIQTYTVIQSLGQFISGLKIILGLKGEDISRRVLKEWTSQICVGTPGTIIDKVFNASKRCSDGIKGFLSCFKVLVVDEADEFLRAELKTKNVANSRSIRKPQRSNFGNLFDQLIMITSDLRLVCGDKFQTLLFSATYPRSVKKLAVDIAPKPFVIKVAQKQVQLDNISIFKIVCDDEIDKFNTLLRVISLANIGQMIIFVNTVTKAKQLIEGLENKDLGIACSALYGRGMDIELRDKTMEEFRKNQTQCLVASNVIARGIDVPAVCLVVNFEIPMNEGQSVETGNMGLTFDSETFMHRVGRTGRFGAKGVCINLIAKDDDIGNQRLDAIQKEYSLNITEINNTAQSVKDSITNWLTDNV